MDNEKNLEKIFKKDRQLFWEKRLNDRYNRPPTRAELLRLGAVTTMGVLVTIGVVVGTPVYIATQLEEPAATLVWMISSVAAIPEGILAMKYGPDVVLKTDELLSKLRNPFNSLAI